MECEQEVLFPEVQPPGPILEDFEDIDDTVDSATVILETPTIWQSLEQQLERTKEYVEKSEVTLSSIIQQSTQPLGLESDSGVSSRETVSSTSVAQMNILRTRLVRLMVERDEVKRELQQTKMNQRDLKAQCVRERIEFERQMKGINAELRRESARETRLLNDLKCEIRKRDEVSLWGFSEGFTAGGGGVGKFLCEYERLQDTLACCCRTVVPKF